MWILLLCVYLFIFPVITKPPYEVSETGWGEFEVVIKIFFVDSAEKPVSLGETKHFPMATASPVALCS